MRRYMLAVVGLTLAPAGLLAFAPGPAARSVPRASFDPPVTPACVVVQEVVSGSAAEKAGLKAGDRLLSYDGRPLASPAALQALSQNMAGKRQANLRLQRGGENLTLSVPVGSLGIAVRPALSPAALSLSDEGDTALRTSNTAEAIRKWAAAADLAASVGDRTAAAWLRWKIGTTYENERQWREAQQPYAEAMALARDSRDPAMEALMLCGLARCSEDLGDLAAALRWYEKARQIDVAAGNERWASDRLTDLGVVSKDRGDLDAAQDYFRRALAIRERLAGEVGDPEVAATLLNLGVVLKERGDLAGSEQYYTRALAVFERVEPGSMRVAICLNNLANLAHEHGDFDVALERHRRALAIRERMAPNSRPVADSLDSLGDIARHRGLLQDALDYSTRALAIYQRVAPSSPDIAGCLNNLGNIAISQGDLDAAEAYFSRALAIHERLRGGSTPGTPTVTDAVYLNNLGIVAHERQDFPAAQRYFSRALAIFEQLAGPERRPSLHLAHSLANMGDVAGHLGDLRASQDYRTRALAIYRQIAPNSLFVANGLIDASLAANDRGDLAAARDFLTGALQIYERLAPGSLEMVPCLNNLGSLELDERRFSNALALFKRAVEIVEAQRRQINSSEGRAMLVERHTDQYNGLLRAEIALGDVPAAFAVLERARARSLVEMLSQRQVDFRAHAPAELLRQQDALDRQHSLAYISLTRLDPNKDEAPREQLRAELADLARQQRALTTQMQAASPKFAALQYPRPLDLKGAQAALDRGTLLLAYYVDQGETYLFAATPADAARGGPGGNPGLQLFRIRVGAQELQGRVEAFRRAVVEQGMVKRRGGELYDLLVRPAQTLVDRAQRVLICPDGALNTLPFAALVVESNPVRYFADLKPLHTIVSMTVYAQLRSERTTKDEGSPSGRPTNGGRRSAPPPTNLPTHPPALLAYGDPEYAGTGSSATRGLPLAALPGTRKEVEVIARLYGPAARVRVGREATKRVVEREAGEARTVHFACHGILDDRDPLGSGLALSPGEGDGGDIGLLQAWEIFERVRLKADLVVLSACETGLGQTTKNEGVVGLTRALQYAGAKSVVMSLWSVADESTAALMEGFYRELKKGTSKDVALQRAMAAVRKDPRWRHPFFWAPFVLAGEWR
jgi:CHAT domain-containing protein/Tfp pilus assembly protein PilF